MGVETVASYLSVTNTLLLGVLGCVIYFFLSWTTRKTPANLPPGPRGWKPVLKLLKATRDGNMHELASEWSREYGPIVLFYNMGHPVVLLGNAEVSRKLLASEEYKNYFVDRQPLYATRLAFYNSKDVIFTSFDTMMRKKRRMVFHLLGLYGDGVKHFEQVVGEELDRLIQEIDRYKDEDIDLPKYIGRSLKAIFYILTFGERPPDVTTADFLEEYDLAFNHLLSPSVDFVLNYLPFLAKIPGPFKTLVDKMTNCKAKAEDLVYHKPKSTYIPDHPRGMADLLFDLQNKPGYEWMANDHEHVIAFLMSLFAAGHITTRATLLGVFLCLLNNKEAVKKIQTEIDEVLGDRRPTVEDRARMPYTEASILEALRVVSQSPLSAFRVANQDVLFEGMTIPKGSVMIINHWYFLHDEKLWDDPWTFRPERFLDDNGQILPANHPIRKSTISFGIGVRSCPGEVFARSRAFLFVAHVLQNFDLLPPVNEKLKPADFTVNDENVKGFVRQVQSYKARLRRRQKLP